jgi:hypothetical protein
MYICIFVYLYIYGRAPALLALAPFALVLADARAPPLLASAPSTLVLADSCLPPALLAWAPFALVLADARAPALLAFAPRALALAEARAPALLAFAPLALVRADTVWLLLLFGACYRCVGLLPSPARAGAAAADARCLVRHSTLRAVPVVHLAARRAACLSPSTHPRLQRMCEARTPEGPQAVAKRAAGGTLTGVNAVKRVRRSGSEAAAGATA